MTAESVWTGLVVLKDKASYIPREKFALLHKAAIDACDALDGVADA